MDPGDYDFDEVWQEIAAHWAINNAERHNWDEPDDTYVQEWQQFCAFVDEHRTHGRLPQSRVYAERHAINLYFTSIVVHDKRYQNLCDGLLQ